MKNIKISAIIVSLLLLCINSIFAQEEATTRAQLPINRDTQKITYQEIVDQQGSADELYVKSMDWLNAFFSNPPGICSTMDRENAKIEGNHNFDIHYINEDGIKINAGRILYSFKVEFKENKYRYTITDFVLKKASRYPIEKWLNENDPDYSEKWDLYLKQVDDFAKDFIKVLKEKMQPEKEIKDEW